MGLARRSDNFAVLVVPNVKVKTEAVHSIPALSFHGLLGESVISSLHGVGYINALLQKDVSMELGLSLQKNFH